MSAIIIPFVILWSYKSGPGSGVSAEKEFQIGKWVMTVSAGKISQNATKWADLCLFL
ncbi:hypothetical protein [Janthinobacterium sp. AD80]|uniref:hypothetical protein n=1 Tax=Janthinobacterium sp. AD80 TaxID=1528773 RepID=UPI0015E0DEF6|nr:hypothetical protein [Janthinobacterium sp. AD80]